jgi:prevent-host-death family protein
MKQASISELKNQLSAYLRCVRGGEPVIVYDRKRPIARIERVADEDYDDRIAQLQRDGLLAPPVEPMPMDLLRSPAPHADLSVLEALIEARETSR